MDGTPVSNSQEKVVAKQIKNDNEQRTFLVILNVVVVTNERH